ncbi:MAG: YqhA family protein [Pseudomonadota bacterium]
MFGKLLGTSRYMIIIAVLGSIAASFTLLIYGFLEALQLIVNTIQSGEVTRKGAKAMAIEFIEIIDLFLMATVFLIIAIGLYRLFISPNIAMPPWLQIDTLDDLKTKLIAVVIVVMGVIFLGHLVAWDGQQDLLGLGVGTAAVIGTLTWFLNSKPKKAEHASKPAQE